MMFSKKKKTVMVTEETCGKIIISEFGSPDVLKLIHQEIPKPDKNQILIKVHSAALNPIDYKIRNGSNFMAKRLKDHLPIGLGYDFSGEIVGFAGEIRNFKVGANVLGLVPQDNPGSYAEYLLTTENLIIGKPHDLSFSSAACLPTAGLTAFQALELLSVKAQQRILIQAGAGGVGHMAIQLAKLMGAYVITTASARNHEFLYALGADQCIDYRSQNFVDLLVEKVDAVIDLVGGEVGMQSLEVLKSRGKMVTVPSITAEKIVAAGKSKNLYVQGMLKKFDQEQLKYLAELAANGKLKIEIERAFSLSEAVEAQSLLESGRVRGKLVFDLE